MKPKKNIVLLGKSLLMAGVESLLSDLPDVSLSTGISDEMGQTGFYPHVILFDTYSAEAGQALRLLERFPHARLVALDLTLGRALSIRGQELSTKDLQELSNVILAEPNLDPSYPKR